MLHRATAALLLALAAAGASAQMYSPGYGTYGAPMSNFLSSKGFVYVGRARGANGKQARYWSRHPDVVTKPNLQAWIDDFIELASLKV